MTRLPHLRAGLISATLVVLVVAAWLLVAPTQIGGETSYVTTTGISMSPRFHSGDLGVVRPAATTAWGTSSPTTARRCASSSCTASSRSRATASSPRATTTTSSIPITPRERTWSASSPSASPHGGLVLHWLHTPFMAALLCGGMALLLFMGAKQRRRRRDRRRPLDERGIRPARAARQGPRPSLDLRDPREDRLHHLRGGRSRLPRLRRARLHAPHDQALGGQDALHREGQLRLPRQGVGRAGLPRRRREHGRPDLRQARARRPRQGSLPPAGQGARTTSAAPWSSSCSLSSPTGWSRTIQLAAPKRFTGDYASGRRDARRAAAAVADPQGREADRQLRGLSLQRRGHAARAPGRDARRRAAHERLRAGPEAPARPAEAPSRHERVLRRRRRLGG